VTYTSRAKQELKLLRGVWGVVTEGVKMLDNQAEKEKKGGTQKDRDSWLKSTGHNEANKMEGV
jgi:hypothetical protein